MNGTKEWYLRGQRHREDGPAIELARGQKEWYLYGQRHRDRGPAVEYTDGSTMWFRHGLRHRADGPAIDLANGTKSWYLDGRKLTRPEWLREILKDRPVTTSQHKLLHALSENWESTPDALYEVVLQLSNPLHVPRRSLQ